jgi:hypothetical protein
VKKPSVPALLIGLIPFTAVCFSVSLWDRVHPLVLGLPFNLFWLILWILCTPLLLWTAYRIERPQNSDPSGDSRKDESR